MAKPSEPVIAVNREKHLLELGRFISVYGILEAMLRFLLQKIVGVDDATEKAIFSGVRTEQASSLIRRCYEARGEKLPEGLEKALKQLAVLTNLRNDLLHHGVDFHSQPPVSSNRSRVLNVKAIRETIVTEAVLDTATLDCGRVLIAISAYLNPADDADEALAFATGRPWNYTPQSRPSARPARSSKKTRPKQKPGPRSSSP